MEHRPAPSNPSGMTNDEGLATPESARREFHRLLDPIDLSNTSNHKYNALIPWLEHLLDLEKEGLAIKAISESKQIANRFGELEGKNVKFALLVVTQENLAKNVANKAAERVATGKHARAFGIVTKNSKGLWSLRTLVEPEGGGMRERWQRLFPEMQVQRPTPSQEVAEPRDSLRAEDTPEDLSVSPRLDFAAIHRDFSRALREAHLSLGADHDEVVRTFLVSLATKRFLILTGLSGSGKTQIAMRFGEWLGEAKWRVIPVRPDWTGAEALFGYEDALLPSLDGNRAWNVPEALQFMLTAARNPDHAHLLVLDEMNLAHVERYFADFLSGMETGQACLPNLQRDEGDGAWRLVPDAKPSIPIPQNLFVVGTVNIDETTYLFSPKVLDRANTIEFRVGTDDLHQTYRKPQPCKPGPRDLTRGFLALTTDDDWHLTTPAPGIQDFSDGMRRIHRILAEDGFEFGHRVFHEALRFASMFAATGELDPHRALDRQIMQKVLPRLHGSRRRLESTLSALGAECVQRQDDLQAAKRFDPVAELPAPARFPISLAKIRRMVRSLRANQFTSFTE